MTVFDSGACEPLKAVVHGSMLALLVVCCGYNSIAWTKRRQRHLLVNAIAYGVLSAWEATHVIHHMQTRGED